MQIGKDTPLRLMMVDDSGEDAEAVISTLRNGGIAVRSLRPLDANALAQMIQTQPIDLVLAARSANTITPAQVLSTVSASGKDIPVLVITDALDQTDWLNLRTAGARDLVVRGGSDHLLRSLRNEWTDLETRRRVRRLDVRLRELERRCDALISSSRDPIAYLHEGMHIRANAAYLDMLGFSSFDEAQGVSLLDLVAPQYVNDLRQLFKSLSRGEPPPPHFELQARSLSGEQFPATLELTPATYEGESCVQVVFRRHEEFDPELARKVEELRQRDMVTGLLNRPAFLRALDQAIDQIERGEYYSLMLLEPDHYPQLLQGIGIGSADALIAAMAQRLTEALGSDTLAARFGEHTFALLTKGQHAHTLVLADRLRTALASHVFNIGERSTSTTVSIGGVQIGEKIANVGLVLTHATDCLQNAVSLGGNRTEIFDPGAVDRAEEERVKNWIVRLQDALTHHHFQLHYQPVISLQGDTGEIYEALLRLNSNGEMVMPQAFMSIAEDHDLLNAIDRWVVNRAIEVLSERHRHGHLTQLLVKISPVSFGDGQLLQIIAKQLSALGIPGHCLWLQMAEAKVFTHLRQAQAFQAAVTKLGCKVGLEHFGAGLDSFRLLSHFQPDFLKVDPMFCVDLVKTPEHQQKIREIAERAQAQNIVTIAGHVEEAATMSFLFTSMFHYVQGNFLAAPGPQMTYDFS